jgi:hypothetical protein
MIKSSSTPNAPMERDGSRTDPGAFLLMTSVWRQQTEKKEGSTPWEASTCLRDSSPEDLSLRLSGYIGDGSGRGLNRVQRQRESPN